MISRLDRGIILVLLSVMGVGLVQVYSSSYIFAAETYGSGLYFFNRQFLFVLLGLGVLFSAAMFPSKWIEKWGWTLWIGASIGVALTLVPGLGVKVGGAVRWLELPGNFRFEPGELVKLSVSVLFASCLTRRVAPFKRYNEILWLVLFALPLVLLLQQPDFGSFAITLAVAGALLVACGLKLRYIIAALAVAIPSFYFLIFAVPYRRARIFAFLDPWQDPAEKGFQVIQSMLGIHAGGLFGVGLGQGQAKLFFLPEAHTDFTLAVLAEEMGFIGIAVVMTLYGFLLLRGFQIAVRSQSRFRQCMVLGLIMTFGLSVVINAGVVLGMLPTKGLTLPFLSYGGSSLVTFCLLFGLILNADRADREERGRAKPSWG